MSIDGFDELLKTLDTLGKTGDKVGKKAIKKACEIALPIIKKEAPKNKKSLIHQADSLNITNIKSYKSGNIWGHCGIDKKNWNKTKGLYFQNYGFIDHWSNTFIDKNIGWMEQAIKKCKGKPEAEITKIMKQEIKKLL